MLGAKLHASQIGRLLLGEVVNIHPHGMARAKVPVIKFAWCTGLVNTLYVLQSSDVGVA